jgi:molybdopterin-containing oxidoreductase family iron-sulfur binding subunit
MTCEPTKKNHLDLPALRAHLETAQGPRFWRSLEELADTEEFRAYLQSEFPQAASATDLTDPVSRRNFLKLMGASLALAGLNACTRQPTEQIFPYTRAPEEIIPGQPLYFATAMPLGGMATGLLVESHIGRPTKVEGNPQHPASVGATDIFAQASVLTLYDPDRSEVVMFRGGISTWSAFLGAINLELERQRQRPDKGGGLRILTETVTSPTLAQQLRELLAAFPAARWHQYEPVNRDNAKSGARLAFGEVVETQYRIDQADVILSLDADFLAPGPGSVRYARDFTARRRVEGSQAKLNRLYVAESTPSITGAMADHRFPLRASEIENVARALAHELGVVEGEELSTAEHAKWVSAVARDFQEHRGVSLVVAGDQQPPIVHALAHAMNQALGNVGKTVIYTDSVEANPVEQVASLRELVNEMQAGQVEMLIIIGGNPVFTAPADFELAKSLDKVGFRVHLSLYDDETSALCHWHIPETHYLESWSDTRAYDGTITIMQPLIAPLYNGKSAHELLAVLLGQPDRPSHDIVRGYWNTQDREGDFDRSWKTALHDGLIQGSALVSKPVQLKLDEIKKEIRHPPSAIRHPQSVEVVFRPDPTIGDGRFANNGWLQELPKPLTKLTWDNAALISPRTAERLQLTNEQVVELRTKEGQPVRAPIWILPGHADECVTVYFGYGRTRAGRVGNSTGFNAYPLRRSNAFWFGSGLQIQPTDERYPLASTQQQHSMAGRHLVRVGTTEEYREKPTFAQELGEDPPRDITLYPEHPYEGYAWGMAVDLNACIGCNACVVACQSENNISVVGKADVINGRAMHWIRIDRYFEGESLDNPGIYHQPVMCQHCENAPCEVVCPVNATVHDREGLNVMVYNRCVGTRYCSNNCPYKVRRFNFRLYADWTTESLKPLRNPDVTVRSRGVMEKCTYCVQRISAARIQAKKEDREIQDGEVMTACQQVCPAQAIVLGNINDPNSRVAKLKAHALNYGILTDLNTRPRTTYLARLRNPNSEIEHE